MLAYLTAHLGYILVTLVLILTVAAILRSMARERKRGGSSSCGGGCGGCPNAPYCHPGAAEDKGPK